MNQETKDVECFCPGKRRFYTGNLNFAKSILNSQRLDGMKNVDLIIRDCESLRLELNFHNIASIQPFNLRIYDSSKVEINSIELSSATNERQTIVVKNISDFKIQGRVQCRKCQEEQETMLNIQMENVSKFSMVNTSVSLPLKLTGRHMEEVVIRDSSFSILQWPGVFLHNSRHVEIVRNFFLHTMPRSISISLGDTIIISHNLLDVGEALIVEQYEHQMIKCNKISPSVLLPASCDSPAVLNHNKAPLLDVYDDISEKILDDNEELVDDSESHDVDDIVLTMLGTIDTLGLVWIIFALVMVTILVTSACCVHCNKHKRHCATEKKTSGETRPDYLTIPFTNVDDDADEYSESSRAHLASGQQETWSSSNKGLPQYVTVQALINNLQSSIMI